MSGCTPSSAMKWPCDLVHCSCQSNGSGTVSVSLNCLKDLRTWCFLCEIPTGHFLDPVTPFPSGLVRPYQSFVSYFLVTSECFLIGVCVHAHTGLTLTTRVFLTSCPFCCCCYCFLEMGLCHWGQSSLVGLGWLVSPFKGMFLSLLLCFPKNWKVSVHHHAMLFCGHQKANLGPVHSTALTH